MYHAKMLQIDQMFGFSNVVKHYHGSKTMMLKAHHGYFKLFLSTDEGMVSCMYISKQQKLLLRLANLQIQIKSQ